MAKISELPVATSVTGTETFPIVQSGTTKQSTLDIVKTWFNTLYVQLTNLAASSGSSLVGFIQSGTGAVARTVQSKNRDIKSFIDYGGHGDNVVDAINGTALTARLLYGGQIYIPDGIYAFTTPFSSEYDSGITQVGSESRRYSIVGASKNNVIFTYYGTGYLFTSTGTLGTSDATHDGIHSFDTLSNMCMLSGVGKTCNAIKYIGKSYFDISNVHIGGFSEAIRLDKVFSSKLDNVYLRDNNYGLVLSGTPFPNAANAIHISRITLQLNSVLGLLAESMGECVSIDGGTVENNGTQGNASTGGIKINITSDGNGFSSGSIRSTYFEQNHGDSDITITNSGSQKVVYTIENCFFNRAYLNEWTTNNIKLVNTGSGSLTVIVKGCSFFSTNTYVPSAARPFFNVGTGCTLINGGANSFSEITSLPNAPANRFGVTTEVSSVGITAAGAINYGPVGVTVTHTAATGIYIVTHPLNWGLDVNSYSASAQSNDNGGVKLIVQGVIQSNLSQITIVTVNPLTGVYTDCPFTLTVNRFA